MTKADIGVIGLAVMGENLVLNMANQGFTVAVYNRTTTKVDDFVKGRGKNKIIIPCYSIEEFCLSLKTPRKVLIMVKAGVVVDEFIEQLLPNLEKGDIIIDGGNSHFTDTNRRVEYCAQKGLFFVGAGISGGEEGALNGPSIMPGGAKEAWPQLKSIFQKISAKVEDGSPCCDWVGEGGAGHFVKMIHNGIEYGDMQLICEAYQLMRDLLKLDGAELHQIFSAWNERELNSYLIEITAQIFSKTDEETGDRVVDLILDAAGQKGTGKWTVNVALDLGIPVTLISEAVFARCLSAIKEERVIANKVLSGPQEKFNGDKYQFISNVKDALYSAKIVSYAQGFALLRAAAKQYNWKLDYGSIAMMWRGGCIIRSKFLDNIKNAFGNNPELENLLLDPFFKEALSNTQNGWRQVAAAASLYGIPAPAINTALCYYDGYRTENLPANLLQAQRDFFGAHMYERIDRPRGEFFHTNWTGKGGTTASSAYSI